MNLNRAIIVGRLTDDPEARALPSGQSVANFSVATNRNWTDKEGNKQEDTQFHNVVAFGRLADIASRYLTKGSLAMIEGRIQTRSWEDADGNRRYRTEIITENLQLGPRAASHGGGTPEPEQARGRKDAGSKGKKSPPASEEEIPVIDQDADDIPF